MSPIASNTSTRCVVNSSLSRHHANSPFIHADVRRWDCSGPALQLHVGLFLPAVFRPNRHGVRQPRRFAHLCHVQPQLQRGGGELPLGHDGVHLCAQRRLCGMGWLEHCAYRRLPKHRHRRQQFVAIQLEHHSQRLLHVHPEHQRVRLGWIGRVVRDHPERLDGFVNSDVQFGCHLQRLVRRRVL